jgi:transcriptional regulator of acetoin/glycerol metabolism
MVRLAARAPCTRTTDRARDRFLSGDRIEGVRDEIRASWRRSHLFGADPSDLHPPYDPLFDPESPLLRAASPVLVRLGDQVAGEAVAVILSDAVGRIVARRTGEHTLLNTLDGLHAAEGFVYSEDATGTNGLGTAIETRHPISVVGGEHFADRLVDLTCVGVPIIHPITRQLAGVIDLTCRATATNGLILPLVQHAAEDIAGRLCLQHGASDRALLLHFQQASRSASIGIMALSDRCTISNPTASRLLAGIDHSVVSELAGRAVTENATIDRELALPGCRVVKLHVAPVHDEGTPIGALITIRAASDDGSGAGRTRADVPGRSPPGMIGHSAVWRMCCERSWLAMKNGQPIVLSGEPGVGKTELAHALHRAAWGDDAPCVVMDAATARLDGELSWVSAIARRTMPAAPGTLVVRNLHTLTPSLSRALRSTWDGLVRRGWRFIGTETRLESEGAPVRSTVGLLIEVPPLRERLTDVPALVNALAARRQDETGRHREISAEIVQLFQRLTWPGNVAQLAGTIDGFLAQPTSGPVRLAEFPPELLRTVACRPLTRLECAEVHTILNTLRETGGNRTEAAHILQISRTTLYRKLRDVGIDLANITF